MSQCTETEITTQEVRVIFIAHEENTFKYLGVWSIHTTIHWYSTCTRVIQIIDDNSKESKEL